MPFSRLIRFVDDAGEVNFGDLGSSSNVLPEPGLEVDVLSGDIEKGFEKNGEKKKIKSVSLRSNVVILY